MLEQENGPVISDVVGSMTKPELATLVAADSGGVDLLEANRLGASIEALRGLEAAGLLTDKTSAGKWYATGLGKACAEALCQKCLTLMSPGKALIGPPPGITFEGPWPAKYRDCTKCHSCGHSEYSVSPFTPGNHDVQTGKRKP